MKKIFLSLLLVAGCYAVTAQNDDEIITYTSIGNYKGYAVAVPSNIQITFEREHPAMIVTGWDFSNGWYHTYYTKDNRIINVYYNPAGLSYGVALPVVMTQVPETVVTKAIDLYGNTIYSVTRMKSDGDMDIYQVRLLENGQTRTVWLNEDGSTAIYPYRTEMDDDDDLELLSSEVNAGMSGIEKSKEKTEMDKQKVKTKTSDGNSTKQKSKDEHYE